MWQPNLLHRQIHWHLPSPLLFPPTTKNPNTKQVHKGHPTVYTSLKCTIAANYDCTNKELKELNEAVSDALPHVVTWPGLDKTALKHHLLHLAKIQLAYNYFSFNNKLYHQITRASMGAKPLPETCYSSNPGTLDQKLATQKQDQNLCTIPGNQFMLWENATKNDKFLPHCQQLSPKSTYTYIHKSNSHFKNMHKPWPR